MIMRLTLRLGGAGMLAIAPASLTEAQSAAKNLAIDYRTSTWVEGTADTGVVTAHAVTSGTKFRIDMDAASGRGPKPFPADGPVSIIVSDSGRTFAYLDTKNNQYAILRPGDTHAQLEKMGVKKEFSGTETGVENLGAGPTIRGHPTLHYRLTMRTTMTHSVMGHLRSVTMASVIEHYFPADWTEPSSPTDMSGLRAFARVAVSDMLSMYGTTFKDFEAKMHTALNQLPKAMPLRTSTTITVTTEGGSRTSKSTTDYTSVQWVNADPKVFEIPASYKLVEFSAMVVPPPNP